jgi:hypothetical protein
LRDRLLAEAQIILKQVLRRGLLLGTYKPKRTRPGTPAYFVALGIVPNWVSAIRLEIGSNLRTIQVPGKAYSVRSKEPIVINRLIA